MALLSVLISVSSSAFGSSRGACDAAARTELPSRFYKDSRAQIAALLAQGEQSVLLVIAAAPGSARCVDAAIRSAGGKIHMRSDAVDYVRATVPLPAVEKLLGNALVEAADISRAPDRPNPITLPSAHEEKPAAPGAPPVPSVSSQTAASLMKVAEQFAAIDDLAHADWRARHPTYDGRGVTIAIVESALDILHPDLQLATSLDGQPIPKVIGHLTVSDPDGSSGAVGPWVQMKPQAGPSRAGSRRDDTGRYMIGVFDLRTAEVVPHFEKLVESSKGPLYGVLWDRTARCVKVDTDQDDSFDDERCLRDFHFARDIGTLPVKGRGDHDPELLGFTVQVAAGRRAIAINVGGPLTVHSTLAAGAATAHADSRGGINGVAPGARLVAIHTGMTVAGQIEGLIEAFEDRRVDIVVLEQAVERDHYYALADGANVEGIVTERLIRKFGKPFLRPASNNPGLNQVGSGGSALLSIGMYARRENLELAYRRDFGDAPYVMGSYGPTGNGGMQPQFLAPAFVVSTSARFFPNAGLIVNGERAGGYDLCSGTSCAAPIAAGAIACLISAAKQKHLDYGLDRLKWALANSAEYVGSAAVYRQGYGLLKIDEALNLLELAAMSRTEGPVDIEFAAPVATAVSQWFNPPSAGRGLYEREGWTAGDHGVRTLKLRRKQGRRGVERFKVALRGNDDGTFVAPSFVDLPLDREVLVEVEIRPSGYGVHGARLDLLSSESDRIVASSLMTIVAARHLTSDRAARWNGTAALRPGGVASEYFYVPPGQELLTIEAGDPRTVLTIYRPDRLYASGWLAGGLQRRRTFPWPEPGVWEVVIADSWIRTDAAVTDRSVPVRAELQATLVQDDKSSDRELLRYQFMSTDGRFNVQALQVPNGTGRISVEARTVGEDVGADVDLYLFDCTSGQCIPRASAASPEAREHLTVTSPAPGLWKLVSDLSQFGARSRAEVSVGASID